MTVFDLPDNDNFWEGAAEKGAMSALFLFAWTRAANTALESSAVWWTLTLL